MYMQLEKRGHFKYPFQKTGFLIYSDSVSGHFLKFQVARCLYQCAVKTRGSVLYPEWASYP